jgi:DEAD/DEAH box helicase domain-containing protein
MCDAQDIGYSFDTVSQKAGGGAVVTIYDQHPGGIGLSAKIYQLAEELIQQCAAIISSCGCKNGCPSCVGPSGENDVGGKKYALALIQEIYKVIGNNG